MELIAPQAPKYHGGPASKNDHRCNTGTAGPRAPVAVTRDPAALVARAFAQWNSQSVIGYWIAAIKLVMATR